MTRPSERLDAALRELGLKSGQFFLGGSSGLALRDLRDFGDIDIGVTTRYWFELHWTEGYELWTTDPEDERRRCDPPYLIRRVNGIEVNVFHSWRWRGHDETEHNDFNLTFAEGIELVKGWPCVKLPILLRMKVDAINHGAPVRPKDIQDIEIIANYLGNSHLGYAA